MEPAIFRYYSNNEENLKQYISLKMEYELLKQSNLYLTDLKQYISKSINYQTKLKSIKI